MSTMWEKEWQDAKPGQIRFLAEFTWDGTQDEQARIQFQKWHTYFPTGPINEGNTQGYYITGARTFWIISSINNHNDWDQVAKFCNKVTGQTKVFLSPIQYNYYECLDPQPLRPDELES